MRKQSPLFYRRINGRGSTQLVCPACKKVFRRPNAHIRGSLACCSIKCATKARTKRQKIMIHGICNLCGSPFSRRKGSEGTMEYCSRLCARKGAAPKGRNHPNWKGGVAERPHSVRTVIKKRVKEVGKCQRCGANDNLHGHHIRSYADHPSLRIDPSNIKVLCRDCHKLEHPKLAAFLAHSGKPKPKPSSRP